MNPEAEIKRLLTRRHFFGRTSIGLGSAVLAQMVGGTENRVHASAGNESGGVLKSLHFAPKAKRVIYLFMSQACPSQMDMWDYKPLLNEKNGQELPDSVRGKQRLTGMSGNQSTLPLAGSLFKFAQHGRHGTWVSELLAAHCESCRRSVHNSLDDHRGDQPRSSNYLFPNRIANCRKTLNWIMAQLWLGYCE